VIRLVYLLRRAPHLSLEEFQRYWREQHGPLVASHQQHLRILKYVQVHRVDDPAWANLAGARGEMEPPYDGTAELWWESEEELAAASGTDEGRAAGAALLDDERRFIDLPNSPLWLAHEYPQVNPAPETIVARERNTILKLYFPLRHHPQQSLEEAQRYWRVQHGPLIRRNAPAMGMLRYLQVHRYESPVEAELRAGRGTAVEPYTGHAEAWFDGAVARSSAETRAAGRAAVADERHFIDFGRSNLWVGKEHVIIDRM
jgi:uncharacterized protein (TIGR02118 family)